MKLDHIGIAVESLDRTVPLYELLLGKKADHFEEISDQRVKTAFFSAGDSRIELLEATSEESPVARFIKKNGRGGIHHICIETDDIQSKLKELKKKGIRLIDEKPRPGAGGRLVAFIHPQSMGHVLVELVQIRA